MQVLRFSTVVSIFDINKTVVVTKSNVTEEKMILMGMRSVSFVKEY